MDSAPRYRQGGLLLNLLALLLGLLGFLKVQLLLLFGLLFGLLNLLLILQLLLQLGFVIVAIGGEGAVYQVDRPLCINGFRVTGLSGVKKRQHRECCDARENRLCPQDSPAGVCRCHPVTVRFAVSSTLDRCYRSAVKSEALSGIAGAGIALCRR